MRTLLSAILLCALLATVGCRGKEPPRQTGEIPQSAKTVATTRGVSAAAGEKGAAGAAAAAAAEEANGKHIFDEKCALCHSLARRGGKMGPALDGIGARYRASKLGQYVSDPRSVDRASRMRAVRLEKQDITALLAYLGVAK